LSTSKVGDGTIIPTIEEAETTYVAERPKGTKADGPLWLRAPHNGDRHKTKVCRSGRNHGPASLDTDLEQLDVAGDLNRRDSRQPHHENRCFFWQIFRALYGPI